MFKSEEMLHGHAGAILRLHIVVILWLTDPAGTPKPINTYRTQTMLDNDVKMSHDDIL